MAELSLERGLEVLDQRTRIVRGLIYAYIATGACMVAGLAAELSGATDFDAEVPDTLATLIGLSAVLFVVVLIVSVIVVGMWIYRAHANLRASEIDGLEFTPGWAVGWFFIPFANLIKPFQAMRELWTASHAQTDSYGSEADPRLTLWWGCWIVGNIVSNVSGRFDIGGGEKAAQTGSILGIVSTLLLLAAAWFLLQIVNNVNSAQRSMVGLAATFA